MSSADEEEEDEEVGVPKSTQPQKRRERRPRRNGRVRTIPSSALPSMSQLESEEEEAPRRVPQPTNLPSMSQLDLEEEETTMQVDRPQPVPTSPSTSDEALRQYFPEYHESSQSQLSQRSVHQRQPPAESHVPSPPNVILIESSDNDSEATIDEPVNTTRKLNITVASNDDDDLPEPPFMRNQMLPAAASQYEQQSSYDPNYDPVEQGVSELVWKYWRNTQNSVPHASDYDAMMKELEKIRDFEQRTGRNVDRELRIKRGLGALSPEEEQIDEEYIERAQNVRIFSEHAPQQSQQPINTIVLSQEPSIAALSPGDALTLEEDIPLAQPAEDNPIWQSLPLPTIDETAVTSERQRSILTETRQSRQLAKQLLVNDLILRNAEQLRAYLMSKRSSTLLAIQRGDVLAASAADQQTALNTFYDIQQWANSSRRLVRSMDDMQRDMLQLQSSIDNTRARVRQRDESDEEQEAKIPHFGAKHSEYPKLMLTQGTPKYVTCEPFYLSQFKDPVKCTGNEYDGMYKAFLIANGVPNKTLKMKKETFNSFYNALELYRDTSAFLQHYFRKIGTDDVFLYFDTELETFVETKNESDAYKKGCTLLYYACCKELLQFITELLSEESCNPFWYNPNIHHTNDFISYGHIKLPNNILGMTLKSYNKLWDGLDEWFTPDMTEYLRTKHHALSFTDQDVKQREDELKMAEERLRNIQRAEQQLRERYTQWESMLRDVKTNAPETMRLITETAITLEKQNVTLRLELEEKDIQFKNKKRELDGVEDELKQLGEEHRHMGIRVTEFITDNAKRMKVTEKLVAELIQLSGEQLEAVRESLKKVCVVCWERPRTVLFVDCNHIVCCYECAQDPSLDICPYCRAPVNTMKLVVMPS